MTTDPVRKAAVQALIEAFGRAAASGRRNYEAMTLATLGEDGAPSVRTVLARAVDERGVTFYTDRRSRKGRALAADGRAALCWYWEPTEEQASVEGVVEPIDAATADADFARRAPGGQALICASEQSAVLDDEEALRARMDRLAASGAALARPAHWVGLRLVPQRIELWEGRRDRVHLRTVYERTATGAWAVERLSP